MVKMSGMAIAAAMVTATVLATACPSFAGSHGGFAHGGGRSFAAAGRGFNGAYGRGYGQGGRGVVGRGYSGYGYNGYGYRGGYGGRRGWGGYGYGGGWLAGGVAGLAIGEGLDSDYYDGYDPGYAGECTAQQRVWDPYAGYYVMRDVPYPC